MTKSVHCKKEKYDVYVGRPTKWGNPFTYIKNRPTLADSYVGSQKEAADKYKKWIKTQPELMASLYELKDKTLGCWCNKNSRDCHCKVLIELVKKHCK